MVQRVPQLTRTKFLAFGDSVTAGEVTAPALGPATTGRGSISAQIVLPMAAYPAVLNERLTRRYSLQRITVENAGVPREAAAEAVPRFRNAMRASRPDVVLLLQGYNDLGSPSTRRAASSALEEMAKEARGFGARVFLATLTPGVPGRNRAPDPSSILAMNDSIRALAAGERAVLVDLYQAVLPNLQTWIGVDGLHPTEAGYAGIADTFFAAITADLEAR
jgi:lysophospholipase L1-like esterase